MLSSGMKCYLLGLNVIIWDFMLSSGMKCYHLELSYHLGLYHCERRRSINPQLHYCQEGGKITKPLLGHAPFNQFSYSGRAPLNTFKKEETITKPLLGRAPFNQSSNLGHTPFNQLGNFLCHLPPSLCAQLTTLHPPSTRPAETHAPLHHFGAQWPRVRPLASVWTFGDNPAGQTEVRIKHV
jgi:hypothetical protein